MALVLVFVDILVVHQVSLNGSTLLPNNVIFKLGYSVIYFAIGSLPYLE